VHQVHDADNVAIIVNEGGFFFLRRAQLDNGLTLIDAIPEAHKVALCGIAAASRFCAMASVIGSAEVPIAKGSWVHEGFYEFAGAATAG